MANIYNIDRNALRDEFSRLVHTEVDDATRRYRRAGEAMNLTGMFSVGDNVLELDPLVKYRFVGREAIDDLDFSEAINASSARTWGDSRYYTPFFTQGVPYWGIGKMAMNGVGTSQGYEPSNPFLIATYGDDWISNANGENLELSSSDIDQKVLKQLAKQRGLTPDKINTLQGFSNESEELRKQIVKIIQRIETEDIAHRSKIPEGKRTPQDYLERSAQIPEVDSLLKQHKELTKRINQFGPEISTHILGDSSKGILPWVEQFARTNSNPAVKANSDYLSSLGSIEELFPKNIQEFKKPLNERNNYSKSFLSRYPEMKMVPHWKDYSPDLQRLLKLKNSISSNQRGLSTVLSTTDLTPEEFGLIQNSDGSFSVNPAIKTGLENNDPFYLDVSSDEPLFAKIKAGKASPSEISRAFGIGALGNTSYRSSIGDERLDYMAFPNDNIETMPSIIIPRASDEEPYKIPASSVQLANRPFAVWEWDNGKFNLINEGNNQSISGFKPIPTGNISKKGPYAELGNRTVGDLFKKYSSGGYLNVGGLKNLNFVKNVQELFTPDPRLGAIEYGLQDPVTARHMVNSYMSSPKARYNVNSMVANLGTKGITAATLAFAPYDALNRREANFTDFYNRYRRDPTYEENMGLRIQSGLEPALNMATLGMYDILADTPTYKAYLDQEYRDLGRRKEVQSGIDYPIIGGYQVERTTR